MFEDIDEAIAGQSEKRLRVCAFTKWAQSLDGGDQAKAHALMDTDHSNRDLAWYFQQKAGVRISDQTVSRHRHGRCCGQAG